MTHLPLTVLSFLVVLGIIIFVHEFGHFVTAKLFGMRVFIFSFGFGKRLFGVKRGDTDYRVSLVPLGGYVKLEGEADDYLSENTAQEGDRKDFLARPRWQRPQPHARLSTNQLQALLRAELWGEALGVNSEGFAADSATATKPLKITSPLAAAVCYAAG